MRIWTEEREILVRNIRYGPSLWLTDDDWIAVQRDSPDYQAIVRNLQIGHIPQLKTGIFKHMNKDPFTDVAGGDYETGYLVSGHTCLVVKAMQDQGLEMAQAIVTCVDHEFPWHKISEGLVPVPIHDMQSKIYSDEEAAMHDKAIRKVLVRIVNNGELFPTPHCYKFGDDCWIQTGHEYIMARKIQALQSQFDGTGVPSIPVYLKIYEKADKDA